MIIFEKIVMYNFMRFENQIFEFKNKGVYLIEGRVGSGKSSMFEALTWCLFGETLRKADVVNRVTKKNTMVKLYFSVNGNKYLMLKTKKHDKHNDSTLLYKIVNNEKQSISGKDQKDTHKVLENLLGLNFKLFMNIVMFGQENYKSFAEMTDGEIKKIFDILCDFDIYLLLEKHNNEKLFNTKQKHAEIVNLIENKTEQYKEYKQEFAELKNDYSDEKMKAKKQIKNIINEIDGFKIEIESVNKQLLSAEKKSNKEQVLKYQKDIDKLESELEKRNDDWATSKYKLKNVEVRIKINLDAIKNLRHQIKETESNKFCITCGQKLPKANIESVVNKLKTKINEYQRLIDDGNKLLDKYSKEMNEHLSVMETIKKVLNEYKDNMKNLEKLDKTMYFKQLALNLKRRIDDRTKAIDVIKNMLPVLKKRIITKRTTIQELKENINNLKQKDIKLQKMINTLELLKLTFGNQGVKSILLRNITPMLNEISNNFSKEILSGKIQIEFITQKYIKSRKEFKEHFEILAKNIEGADVYKGNSGGEKTLINLCIMEAFHYLVRLRSGKAINLKVYDETFSSLDDVYTEDVYKYLTNNGKDKAVYVISHDSNMKNLFDDKNIIKVVKSKGISKINSSY